MGICSRTKIVSIQTYMQGIIAILFLNWKIASNLHVHWQKKFSFFKKNSPYILLILGKSESICKSASKPPLLEKNYLTSAESPLSFPQMLLSTEKWFHWLWSSKKASEPTDQKCPIYLEMQFHLRMRWTTRSSELQITEPKENMDNPREPNRSF